MLHFIQESQYSEELEQFEPDPLKVDELSRSVEHKFSLLANSTTFAIAAKVDCFLCHQHAGRNLLIWYAINGGTVSLLSIKPG